MKVRFAPSLLAADFLSLRDEIKKAEDAGADMLHYDVMDGVYVPNISFGFPILKQVSGASSLPLDVHMMTACPQNYLETLASCGASGVTIHVDVMPEDELARTLRTIRELGMKPGAALRPGDGAERIMPFIDLISLALVMTVEPGFGGQKFMTDMLPKIAEVRAAIERENPACLLEVDGGLGPDTVRAAAEAGADTFVVGTSAFRAPDMKKAIADMRAAAE